MTQTKLSNRWATDFLTLQVKGAPMQEVFWFCGKDGMGLSLAGLVAICTGVALIAALIAMTVAFQEGRQKVMMAAIVVTIALQKIVGWEACFLFYSILLVRYWHADDPDAEKWGPPEKYRRIGVWIYPGMLSILGGFWVLPWAAFHFSITHLFKSLFYGMLVHTKLRLKRSRIEVEPKVTSLDVILVVLIETVPPTLISLLA